MEASGTRGTTALVYCLISSSLYTGTVQGCWSTPPTGLTVGRGEVHPNWLTVSRGVGSSPQFSSFHVICIQNFIFRQDCQSLKLSISNIIFFQQGLQPIMSLSKIANSNIVYFQYHLYPTCIFPKAFVSSSLHR